MPEVPLPKVNYSYSSQTTGTQGYLEKIKGGVQWPVIRVSEKIHNSYVIGSTCKIIKIDFRHLESAKRIF